MYSLLRFHKIISQSLQPIVVSTRLVVMIGSNSEDSPGSREGSPPPLQHAGTSAPRLMTAASFGKSGAQHHTGMRL
ncbi:hypothetical protein CC78DRAFT_99594 [Lojkania enalia]|uniref:Uncharacterized protein n=1 Tax=Lojkania enalia TaxID=147567 RepID=A0A9P4JWX5_9PLEO|nr:hypothetical protein CC78DRAFT_99594 [Didymosphaeria enalia]